MDLIKQIEINIWGRDFNLPVKYRCYHNGEVSETQVDALKNLVSDRERIDYSKNYVVEYCEHDVLQDDENDKKDNIFSYIMPEYIFVDENDEGPNVAFMCKYRYDLEHGLAVVFSYDGDTFICIQDDIL